MTKFRSEVEQIKKEFAAGELIKIVDQLEMLHSRTNNIDVIFSKYFYLIDNFKKDPYCVAIMESVKALTSFVKIKENEYRITWNY